jgi:hypothetical protein
MPPADGSRLVTTDHGPAIPGSLPGPEAALLQFPAERRQVRSPRPDLQQTSTSVRNCGLPAGSLVGAPRRPRSQASAPAKICSRSAFSPQQQCRPGRPPTDFQVFHPLHQAFAPSPAASAVDGDTPSIAATSGNEAGVAGLTSRPARRAVSRRSALQVRRIHFVPERRSPVSFLRGDV